jgi:hypothetical protein
MEGRLFGKAIYYQIASAIISRHIESDARLSLRRVNCFLRKNKTGNNSGAFLLTIGRFTIAAWPAPQQSVYTLPIPYALRSKHFWFRQ